MDCPPTLGIIPSSVLVRFKTRVGMISPLIIILLLFPLGLVRQSGQIHYRFGRLVVFYIYILFIGAAY